MTPEMQAQLITVYKHFAKHPKRKDAQLAFVRQVDKCLVDHGYELWVEEKPYPHNGIKSMGNMADNIDRGM